MNRCSRGAVHRVARMVGAAHARSVTACGIACIAAALLVGCGSTEELSKQLDTLASWTATVQLAVAEHRAGAITTTYATQLGDDARKARDEARQSLPRAEHDSSDARRAGAALDSLEHAIEQLGIESR
jgi:hypothetical protein